VRLVIYSINFVPELTGVGKYTGEMVEWLSKHGHELYVVTALPYYPRWQIFEGYRQWRYSREVMCEANVWRCPLWVPKSPSGIKRIIHLLSFALSSFPVLVSMKRFKPDLVLVVEPPLFCAPAAVLLSRIVRAKSWLHVQDFEVDAAFDLGLLKANWLRRMVISIEKWIMNKFDRVSTISERMLDRLAVKNVDKSHRIIFPNWVDTEIIYPTCKSKKLCEEIKISVDSIVALYSGAMGQKQGMEIIINAARELESESKIKFVMCGQGATYEYLRSISKDLKNIFWLPLQPIDRLNELLNLADIHLLPQRAGAEDLVMPSKLTGMLASGKPIVATSNVGTQIEKIVKNCGIVVPPEDLESFVGAILELSNNLELRTSLGAHARNYAVTQLDRNIILDRFQQDLLLCCSGRT